MLIFSEQDDVFKKYAKLKEIGSHVNPLSESVLFDYFYFALFDENILFFVRLSLITQKGVFAAEVNLVLYYKLAVGI